ncbi:MAG: class II aldolase/adducin family protein [Nitrospinota bacterium]
MSAVHELREKLVNCLRIFDRTALLGMYGHVSIRLPEVEEFLINPGAGSDKSALRPEDLLRVNFRGEKLEGAAGLPLEVVMHTAIHRRCEDAVAIAHVHPPWATLFAIARTPVRPVVLHGALFGNGVPVFDKAEFIITEEEGEELAEFRGDHRVILLRCHGSIVVGGSLEEVVFVSFTLEENAELQYRAASLGELDPMRPHEVEKVRTSPRQEIRWRKFWDYQVSQLKAGRLAPGST